MNRIKATGCGYMLVPGKTYSCNGIGKFNSAFGTTEINVATRDNWTSELDNYGNIPQKIEGFVMTLSPILDMSDDGTSSYLEVAELDCRTEFNPFVDLGQEELAVAHVDPEWTGKEATAHTGFMNLYENGADYKEKVFVVVDGSTTVPLYNGATYVPGFVSTAGDAYTMGPGMLEPMMDTSFNPISVDVNPGLMDGTNASIAILNLWRTEADKRFSDLYAKIRPWVQDDSNVNGLINLENAKNRRGWCPNFSIVTNTEASAIAPTGEIIYPEYAIEGGTIYIDGRAVPVAGIDRVYPESEFDAYLDIYEWAATSADTPVIGATITTNRGYMDLPESTVPSGIYHFQHKKFEYIGSVIKSTGNQGPEQDATEFVVYTIKQGDCLYDINLSGGTGGGGGGPVEYDGPFKVSGSTTSCQVTIGGIDATGNPLVSKAGWMCLNGTGCTLQDYGYVDVSYGSYDIYASITSPTTINYVAVDTSQRPPEPATNVPTPYNIRLARVEGFAAIYDVTPPSTQATPEGDTVVGSTIHDWHEAIVGGTVTNVSYTSGGSEFTAAVTGDASTKIYTCSGGVVQPSYHVGATTSVQVPVKAASIHFSGIKQIHYGDIYVDGRWS